MLISNVYYKLKAIISDEFLSKKFTFKTVKSYPNLELSNIFSSFLYERKTFQMYRLLNDHKQIYY